MAQYIINTSRNGPSNQWVATFDSYDGAPDAAPQDRLLGMADTEIDAIVDLLTEADLED